MKTTYSLTSPRTMKRRAMYARTPTPAYATWSVRSSVPVMDHTYERYAEFIPGGAPTTPANPSNTPKPVEEHVGQESGH